MNPYKSATDNLLPGTNPTMSLIETSISIYFLRNSVPDSMTGIVFGRHPIFLNFSIQPFSRIQRGLRVGTSESRILEKLEIESKPLNEGIPIG